MDIIKIFPGFGPDSKSVIYLRDRYQLIDDDIYEMFKNEEIIAFDMDTYIIPDNKVEVVKAILNNFEIPYYDDTQPMTIFKMGNGAIVRGHLENNAFIRQYGGKFHTGKCNNGGYLLSKENAILFI